MLNPHGKNMRLIDYYSFPVTIRNWEGPQKSVFLRAFEKGRQAIASAALNLANFFFVLVFCHVDIAPS